MFLFSSMEPGSRDPVTVEPPTSCGKGQDPAGDPETPEAEPFPASRAKMRAASALMFCSISATLVVRMPTALVIV